MKQIYKLTSSIFSLCLTIFLLVTVVYAWYVSNNEAKVEGINCSTYGQSIESVTLKRYYAIQSDSKYTIGEEVTSKLPTYDMLGYQKVIYEFRVVATRDCEFNLNMSYGKGRNNTLTLYDGNYYNYLSNVASFYSITKNTSDFTCDLTNPINFSYYTENENHNDINLSTSVEVIENNNEYISTLYFLFDFNSVNINKLFTDNIGTDFNNKKLIFNDDLSFYVEEV